MEDKKMIGLVNGYLHDCSTLLIKWLGAMLPRVSNNWWQDCVIDRLSFNQRAIVDENKITKLNEFDLAALLRIADKNWYAMRDFSYLPTNERDCIRDMIVVRNRWAHLSGEIPDKECIKTDIKTIILFLEQRNGSSELIKELYSFLNSIDNMGFDEDYFQDDPSTEVYSISSEIIEKSVVCVVAQPDVKGVVLSVENIGDVQKFDVFIDGTVKTFYTGQLKLAEDAPTYNWINLSTLQSYLSAFEINNPSAGNLYSLNAARIDFVPYQFRPALKMIKSDEPRILIADSVGVGKTIEAGLIIKELEARNDLEKIMIICPKPLVSERKWEIEMKQRFDEEFVPVTGTDLRQIISDTNRDGEWPTRFNKIIVPYSIFDSRIFEGDENGKVVLPGLEGLDPAPHFDLVIVDEAHHIRNGSLDKEKAYAYKCTRYFCDRADAVVMLTATPLQTGDDDLFTLLNVLRPDIVLDKAAFTLMSQPNEYISKCASIIRRAEEGWQIKAIEEFNGILRTQWGENVVAENPMFTSIVSRLEQESITREERVQLITDVESLHSFNTMINRTRRKDIQDFCVRRTHTLETEFTAPQQALHDELLNFERSALTILHNARTVPFMMSTIRRQAASCIFGLAPHIRNIIDRRFSQLADDSDIDIDILTSEDWAIASIKEQAKKVLELADNLPEDDPKLQSLLAIVDEKQKEENNKIIIFSTFRHTLYYVCDKLKALGYRVEQIDGSVKDEVRCEIRNRFELPKQDSDALDILLFTEVGSEGLDYQFCNMMINYDLPWNPMRIEQRIGRIDRRGQKSEYVNIYNLITSGTVDADIYNRCLLRIGVFERSIGECEEILGEIGRQIEQLALDTKLTEEERKIKLEQMADNEVRKAQELSRLEDEEKELFGFDLSSKTMTKEIQDAESPWLSQKSLQSLAVMYLNDRLGSGNYILGETEAKTIRLSVAARNLLREDLKKLSGVPNAIRKKWDAYLKGTVPTHSITFDQECAAKDKNAFFITAVHPLIKQAAVHFSVYAPAYVNIRYATDTIPYGEYAFSIYAWNYVGTRSRFKLVAVSENDVISNDFIEILLGGVAGLPEKKNFDERWKSLESNHVALWTKERQDFLEEANLSVTYKLGSLESNFLNRKRALEQQIQEACDENLRRMKQGELENATERYEAKAAEIKRQAEQADIHTSLVAHGIIHIE